MSECRKHGHYQNVNGCPDCTAWKHDAIESRTRLTGWQIVLQSALCHPDWDLATHLDFLGQEGYDIPAEHVEAWMNDPDHPGYIGHLLAGQKAAHNG